MEEPTLAEILAYDMEALRRNIRRHENNILVFTKAIEDAKKQIDRLNKYIKLIEDNKGKR